jgi:hypothetical protein
MFFYFLAPHENVVQNKENAKLQGGRGALVILEKHYEDDTKK